MKIMFVSDIHGSTLYLDIIENIYRKERPNQIIFLGDIYYGSDSSNREIDNILWKFNNMLIIRGNCDSEYDVMTSSFGFLDYYSFDEFGKKFFCSHGNKYNISNYPSKSFDVMVYGHTHKGMIYKDNGKLFLNPGSITYPRGGSVNSYMIIDSNGIYLKDLEQNIIEKMSW